MLFHLPVLLWDVNVKYMKIHSKMNKDKRKYPITVHAAEDSDFNLSLASLNLLCIYHD